MSIHTHQTLDSVPASPPLRRWVKVDVDDELFARLHVLAAQSRMRMQAFLRRYLSDAQAYAIETRSLPDAKTKECSAPV